MRHSAYRREQRPERDQLHGREAAREREHEGVAERNERERHGHVQQVERLRGGERADQRVRSTLDEKVREERCDDRDDGPLRTQRQQLPALWLAAAPAPTISDRGGDGGIIQQPGALELRRRRRPTRFDRVTATNAVARLVAALGHARADDDVRRACGKGRRAWRDALVAVWPRHARHFGLERYGTSLPSRGHGTIAGPRSARFLRSRLSLKRCSWQGRAGAMY